MKILIKKINGKTNYRIGYITIQTPSTYVPDPILNSVILCNVCKNVVKFSIKQKCFILQKQSELKYNNWNLVHLYSLKFHTHSLVCFK